MPLLLTALLLVGSLPVVATSDPATDATEAAIRGAVSGNTGPKGASNLQSEWATGNEVHVLYPLIAGTARYGGFNTGNGATGNRNLYTPITSVDPLQAASASGQINFTYGTAAADAELYSMTVDLFLAAATTFKAHVDLRANGVPIATASVTAGATPTTPAGGSTPVKVTGVAIFDPPKLIHAGDELSFAVIADPATANTLDVLRFAYGHEGSLSRFVLTTDSARVNVWTENVDKITTATFPAAAVAPTTDRTMVVRLAHLNAFGNEAIFSPHSNAFRHVLRVLGPDGKVYYDNEPFTVGNPNLASTVNVASDQRWGAFRDDLARDSNSQATSNGLNMVSYRLTYPAGLLLEGVYKIEVSASDQGWKVIREVVIGGSGSTLSLATLEQSATKEILVGEKTTFRLTAKNTGGARDTLALTATPGATPVGWFATLNPAILTLEPGASADTILTVTPSSQGLAGDLSKIVAKATSSLSGRTSDPLNLTVKLTNVTSSGVRILSDAAGAKVGPGSTRVMPIAVENTGNRHDRFMVTLEGAPLGWTATVTPSLFDLEAKSQNTALLSLRAPADAVRGSFFPLTVKAVGVDNASVTATRLISVQVFQEDNFAFLLFDGVNADGTVKTRASSSITDPLLHELRDEGPDVDGADAGATCTGPLDQCRGGPFTTVASGWDGGSDADRDYDQSTLFRLILVNGGDRDDNVRLVPKLITDEDGRSTALASAAQKAALGFEDVDQCDENNNNANGDGRNDGWRFRLFMPTDSSAGFPNTASAGGQSYDTVAGFERFVTVPAHSTVYVYAEMAAVTPTPNGNPCGAVGNRVQSDAAGARVADPAPGHAVAIEAISQNDPTQRNTHVLNAKIHDAGAPGTPPQRVATQTYTGQANGVALHADNAETVAHNVQVDGSTLARTATYRLRAVNTGNEMDTIRFTVPQSENGWTRTFDGFNTSLAFNNLVQGSTAVPRTAGCGSASVVAGSVLVECTLGAHDEVSFNLKSTAPSGTPIGTLDRAVVTATSKDSVAGAATISQALTLTSRATGSFAFDLVPDVTQTTVSIYAGGSVSVPFTIRNLGTQADRFQADLPTAPATSSNWSGTFALPNPLAVPAGRSLDTLLAIHAPATAGAGAQERFRVRVTSLDTPTSGAAPAEFLDIVVNVVPTPTAFNLVGNPPNVVTLPGQAVDVVVRATQAAGNTAGTTVTFVADSASLPPGWSIVGNDTFNVTYSSGIAQATFKVLPPANAIGTSRAALRVVGTDNTGASRFTEVGVALSAPFIGIRLGNDGPAATLVAPGGSAQTQITLTNLGVNNDTVAMDTLAVPDGWAVTFDPSQVPLQPLENTTINVQVSVPAVLPAGASRLVQARATSADGLHIALLDLNFTTGTSLLGGAPKVNGSLDTAPLETTRWVVTMSNTGTLGDDVRLAIVLPDAYRDIVQAKVTPDRLILGANQSADVQVEAVLPATLAVGSDVNVTVQARSVGPLLNQTGNVTTTLHVLDFRAFDMDGDGVTELAVDRNKQASDGLEQFRDPTSGGLASQSSDLASFINEATRARLTVTVNDDAGTSSFVRYSATEHCASVSGYNSTAAVDGDCDGRSDHFVDSNADNVPDHYVDADRLSAHAITLRKDVNQDLSPEMFIDVDADGKLDQAFDLANAKVVALLQRDIDGDGQLDYVVDLDGDGVADAKEAVVYTKTGTFVVVEKIDVTGDGKLDEVYDTDGDGQPNSFVPNGATDAVAIELRDVTGDGILDWTYDSDGNGRVDSYYDPANGESGLIDSDNVFLDSLKDHWYIGALFGLVLVLFVVLLLVTRK